MPFEFRFLSWGISRWFLFLMGIFPVLFALAFHPIRLEWVEFGILLSLLWVFFVSRGFYQLLKVYYWIVFSGLAFELIYALRDKNFVQMFTAIACLLTFLTTYQWLENRLNRAQYAPDVKWYEGLPKLYPRVQVEVFWNNAWHPALLRKLDDYGMFLFLQKSESEAEAFQWSAKWKKARIPIRIRYHDHAFEGETSMKSVFLARWLGMGLQILPKDLYHFTQYGKIVQNLKGEGYAT